MKWLGRVFVSAFVRRIAYAVAALCLAAILSLCNAGDAKAGTINYAEQGEAYAGCTGEAAANFPVITGPGTGRVWCPADTGRCAQTGTTYFARYANYEGNNPSVTGQCSSAPASAAFNNHVYPVAKTCVARNGQGTIADVGEAYRQPQTCFGGCKMQGESYSYSNGGVMVYGMRNRSYNGDTCSRQVTSPDYLETISNQLDSPKTPTAPECNALGNGQTSCIRANGDHCATASTGKTFCWTPNQTGKQVDGTNAQVKGPVDSPVKKPDVLIPDTDWQRREGHQQTACVNSTCRTYNVTNFTQVPGANSATNGTGNNAADGSGNTSGNGKPGNQDGEGEEDGDSATDSGNCVAPPICVGDTLKCLNIKFQWKIQCHTKPNEVTIGGGCAEGDVPICAGDKCNAGQYAELVQTWKHRCSVEADRAKVQNDSAAGAADAAGDDEAGVVGGLWAGDGVTPTIDRNKVSIGGGALFPDVPLGDGTWSAPPELYSSLDKIKVLVIAAFMVWAFFILWRN